MNQLQILYGCNHQVMTREYDVTTANIIRGTGNADSISMVPNVVNIAQIVDVNDNVLSSEMYNFYGNNIIWLLSNYSYSVTYRTPLFGETYHVTVKYANITYRQYGQSACPRCNGTGWYFTTLPTTQNLQYISGPYLVAQEFLKCLLTIPGTDFLNVNYGGGLMPDGGVLYMDSNLTNEITNSIITAETQCKAMEANDYGRTLSDLLNTVTVTSLNSSDSGVTAVLTLSTMAGQQVQFSTTL